MDYTNIILIILTLILIWLIIFKRKPVVKKFAHIKKKEIVESYRLEMRKLVGEYQNNKKELKNKKVEFIKKANQELNKNIFFNSDEIKQIIYELTIM